MVSDAVIVFDYLIKNGKIYIAQPPLYKIKVGKKISYIKNDEDLFDITIDTAKDNIKFFSEEGGKAKEENFDEIVKYSRRFDSKIGLPQSIITTKSVLHFSAKYSVWPLNLTPESEITLF